MPLVGNALTPANLVWMCAHCGEIFAFVDLGERHERQCKNAKEMTADNADETTETLQRTELS